MFKGLRQNSLFYILDKNNLTLQTGEVESVSNPTTKYKLRLFLKDETEKIRWVNMYTEFDETFIRICKEFNR